MTGPYGVGPNFGANNSQPSSGKPQGRAPEFFTPGSVHTGPTEDAFTRSIPFGGGTPAHNVDYDAVASMSMPEARQALHFTTFGGMTELF